MNKKFSIQVGYYNLIHTDSPREAIISWCKGQRKFPTQTCIIAKSKESIELLGWAKNHKEDIIKIMKYTEADLVYKSEVLVNSMLDSSHGVKEFYDKYGGDMVFPFDIG